MSNSTGNEGTQQQAPAIRSLDKGSLTGGLVMVVLGGVGSVWGGLLGAGVVTLLAQLLQGRNIGDYSVIIFGLVLMIAMVRMPIGIAGWVGQLLRKRSTRRLASTQSPQGASG